MKITTATKITFIRIALLPFIMWFAVIGNGKDVFSVLALILFIAGALTDWLDGFVARKYNQISKLGKFVDQLADKAFITGVMTVFVWTHQMSFWLLAIIILRDTAVSGIRMLAASGGKVVPANYWGKIKTVIQMVYVIFVFASPIFGTFPSLLLDTLAWITGIITVISGATYFKGSGEYLS